MPIWRKINPYLFGKPAIFFYYFLIACGVTYPLIFNLRSTLAGYHDAWQFVWNLWWVKTAVFSGQSPLFTHLLHHPTGISLLFHTLTFVNTIPGIILQTILGLTTTYNLLVLLNFALTGLGVYLLAFYLSKNKFTSFIAGAIVAFSPFMITRSWGHLNLMSFGWLAIFLLYFIKMLKDETDWKKPAIFLILAALADWYYFFYILIFVVLYLIYILITQLKSFSRKITINLALTFLAALIVLSPYLGPMIYQKITNPDFNLPGHDPIFYSIDLYAYFIPGQTSFLGQDIPNIWSHWTGQNENIAYLGIGVLILMLYALFKIRSKKIIFWFLTFLIFAILSLGPYLHINGEAIRTVRLPYYYMNQYIPFVSMQGMPSRFVVMAYLAAALLVSFALSDILKWKHFIKFIIAALITVIIVLDYWPIKFKISPLSVPEFYYTLQKDPGDFAILDTSAETSKVMFYQTIHHKKLIGGYTSREIVSTKKFLENTPVISNIYFGKDFDTEEADPSILKSYNIKYILVGDSTKGHIVDKLKLPTVYASSKLAVYQVY